MREEMTKANRDKQKLCVVNPASILDSPDDDRNMNDQPTVHPPSKLGEYLVTGDIAEGTYGKVKST